MKPYTRGPATVITPSYITLDGRTAEPIRFDLPDRAFVALMSGSIAGAVLALAAILAGHAGIL